MRLIIEVSLHQSPDLLSTVIHLVLNERLMNDAIQRMENISKNMIEILKPIATWEVYLSTMERIGWKRVSFVGKNKLSQTGSFYLIPGLMDRIHEK